MSVFTRHHAVLAAAIFAAVLLACPKNLAWLLAIPAAIWLPISAHLLLHARDHARLLDEANARLHAGRQLTTFRAARRDTLTGLPNRQGFLECLSNLHAKGTHFAIAVIDLDMFDSINANLGEASGDELLMAVAARIQAVATTTEAIPSLAARLDGDSFALLIARQQDLNDLGQAATNILAALSAPHLAAGQLIDAGASIGIAISGQHGQTAEALLRAAQQALTLAKQQGGGAWHICSQDVAGKLLSRQTLREEMLSAIESGQIVPYYQPIVSLPSAVVAKFEILARWKHPDLGLLFPDQFIPLADELGLAGHISMCLLRQVETETQYWPVWCRFAFNVSAGQVRELIGFLQAQPGAWQRRIDLARLDIEISERAIMQDCDLTRDLIDLLHEHGARAVLDDFGSGASNFFHLRNLSFDSVKIGKVFVQSLIDDPRAEACVMAMLWLGMGLNIDIVADGVEDQATATRLAALGCHFAQGFLYARPAPASEAELLLQLPARAAEAA